MKWIDVTKSLPEMDEKVMVWIKWDGESYFEWTDAERDPWDTYYVEPISKVSWIMGSAKNYVITHWARVEPPK